MLQILSEKKKRYFYEQELNRESTVLFEAQENQGEMFGFTENYLKIKTVFNPNWVNKLKKVVPLSINADGTVNAEVLIEEYQEV